MTILKHTYFYQFSAYYNKLKQRKTGKSVESNRQFYFEVEMWSFGVTIYQCATG